MLNFNKKMQAIITGKDVIISEERLKSINHFNEEDVIYCINNLLTRVNELEDALKQVQRNVSGLNGLHHFD